MTHAGGDEALALCQRVLEASSADETEVSLEGVTDRFARFAGDGPTQCADRERADLSVRLRFRGPGGYREARAQTGDLTEAGWRAALERAAALAQASPVDGHAVALEGAVEVPLSAVDPETANHDFGAKAAWVRAAVQAAAPHGLAPAGLAQTTAEERTLVNSAGRAVQARRSRASFSVTASGSTSGAASRGSDAAGWAECIAPRAADVDAADVARRAVEKAVASAEPAPIEPGSYTVVLEPAAVASLLLFATYHGFGAKEVEERSSFLCGRLGARVFAEALSIANDAGHPLHPGLDIDGEGTPVARTPLVEAGVLRGPVTDAVYAARLGVPNTGNAVPQPSSSGPSAHHVCVAAGSESLEELVAGVDDGLLVTQFHYTNLIDPRELVLTGMTRNGTYRIRGGEVVGAVRNLRFTHSLLEALGDVTGVGRDLDVAGALFDGELVTPALRIDGFRFTSVAGF